MFPQDPLRCVKERFDFVIDLIKTISFRGNLAACGVVCSIRTINRIQNEICMQLKFSINIAPDNHYRFKHLQSVATLKLETKSSKMEIYSTQIYPENQFDLHNVDYVFTLQPTLLKEFENNREEPLVHATITINGLAQQRYIPTKILEKKEMQEESQD